MITRKEEKRKRSNILESCAQKETREPRRTLEKACKVRNVLGNHLSSHNSQNHECAMNFNEFKKICSSLVSAVSTKKAMTTVLRSFSGF